jgi:pimeloyl-ACP methyl ester carboxylesterase
MARRSHAVFVDGCEIRYQVVGQDHRDPILLLHGAGGHAGWWRSVVAYLAPSRRLVLPEFSGHGDSGHRDKYDLHTWSREISAVIAGIGAGRVSLVGHSMGGLIALHAAAVRPDAIEAVIAVDSAVIPHPPTSNGPREVKYYASENEGISNFRLRPRATCAAPHDLRAVAREGLRATANGWRWKFDPAVLHRIPRDVLNASITGIRCPVGFVRGGSSEVAGPATIDRLADLLGAPVPSVVIEGAYHHVPLDAPARTAATIEVLLASARVPA